ncbi:MAG TPA: hypothetical protein VEY71_04715 [Chitinophagales bacterium]|nr:hypothetical protein [Chitinophagales bacterium]
MNPTMQDLCAEYGFVWHSVDGFLLANAMFAVVRETRKLLCYAEPVNR